MPFLNTDIKKMWSEFNRINGQNLIELLLFPSSSRTLSEASWVSFFLQVHGGTQKYNGTTIGCTGCAADLIHAKAPAVLPTSAFASPVEMSATVKRANSAFIMKIVLSSWNS